MPLPRYINFKNTLIAIFGVSILVGLGFWVSHTRALSSEIYSLQGQFASTTIAYQSEIKLNREKILSIETENTELSGSLSSEQKRRLELERLKRNNEEKIDTLTKLTTLDPELLKKYSKVYFLSENYTPAALDDIAPEDTIDPTKDVQVLAQIAPLLRDLIDDAAKADAPLKILSGYRSFGTQKDIKSAYKVIYGAGTANQFSAEQGYSEHQLGTTVDFTTPTLRSLEISFEDTPGFVWLTQNAYKYGFVLSYPRSNSFYQYEPWHWRFVGKELAKRIHDEGKYYYQYEQRTIDEYLIKIFD